MLSLTQQQKLYAREELTFTTRWRKKQLALPSGFFYLVRYYVIGIFLLKLVHYTKNNHIGCCESVTTHEQYSLRCEAVYTDHSQPH